MNASVTKVGDEFVFRMGKVRICDSDFDNLLRRATQGYGKEDLRLKAIRDAFSQAAKQFGLK